MYRILGKNAKISNVITLSSFLLGMVLSLSSFDANAGEAKNINLEKVQREQMQVQYNLIKFIQAKLIKDGYDPGTVDGISGPRTQKALEAYQRDHGLKVDGMPGKETLKSLGLK
jgi:hypothetical protein